MSTTCDFGGTLEDNLRDQFVCGLHSESIRQILFAEDYIDYKKAYRLATSEKLKWQSFSFSQCYAFHYGIAIPTTAQKHHLAQGSSFTKVND
ncbi:unnamed protein product [Euphydryas editha]|uniref:Uncharacterized protein n=1 Tax=Euphydryas editha TaxID=104508 RepID=A0AAU9THY1_EUPED|nr:unnamed protein product [Euphydryas editha]